MEEIKDSVQNSIINALPKRLAGEISKALCSAPCEEIRLRVGRRPQLVFFSDDVILDVPPFTREEANELLEKLCRHSVYARGEELKNGYLTCEGGVRVGVCGRPVVSGGRIERLSFVSCFNIRLPREVTGCAENVMPYLTEHGRPVSALIAAPPSGGKTTLLRDIARCFSNGVGAYPVKVAIADERGELAACVDGTPSFLVGARTDVMENAPKAEAIRLLVRSMSPELIVTDEIGGAEDAEAVSEAKRCGVAVIASIHAGSAEELSMRASVSELIKCGVFKRILMLKRNGSTLRVFPVKP
jgi:stage III sporulation protein AA